MVAVVMLSVGAGVMLWLAVTNVLIPLVIPCEHLCMGVEPVSGSIALAIPFVLIFLSIFLFRRGARSQHKEETYN